MSNELYDVYVIWEPSGNESPRTGPFGLTQAKALASEVNRRLKLNPTRKGRAKVMTHVPPETMLGWAGEPTPTSKPCPGYTPDEEPHADLKQ